MPRESKSPAARQLAAAARTAIQLPRVRAFARTARSAGTARPRDEGRPPTENRGHSLARLAPPERHATELSFRLPAAPIQRVKLKGRSAKQAHQTEWVLNQGVPLEAYLQVMKNAASYETWPELEADLEAAIPGPAPVEEPAASAAPALTVWGTPAVPSSAPTTPAEPAIEPPALDVLPQMDASCTAVEWQNPDITALTSLPACPARLWVTSVDAPKSTAETKSWNVGLLWYRGVEDGGWKFTDGTVTLHFHPVPTSPNYLHLKRTDAASPTTGVMTNNHWLVAELGIAKKDVTPQ